ncbi:hypothetical protein [Deinococcus roseus]|uniref:Uncharacterized protein n=1 Tax=Deinococcus roseus TaxID=392414 RepID=A0ABQ2CVV3_9DEIO|nr:hypothetical protein [Deinococcus roseus]GGJ25841.1 hypothetical protein GCM10008938_09940 [Deinococcus roseus]
MDPNQRTTEQLTQYLQHLVAFTDPSLMVGGSLDAETGDILLQVIQEVPDEGVVLRLQSAFMVHNQDARVLEVIRSRVHYWLSRGLPLRVEHFYHEEPVSVEAYGTT